MLCVTKLYFKFLYKYIQCLTTAYHKSFLEKTQPGSQHGYPLLKKCVSPGTSRISYKEELFEVPISKKNTENDKMYHHKDLVGAT